MSFEGVLRNFLSSYDLGTSALESPDPCFKIGTFSFEADNASIV